MHYCKDADPSVWWIKLEDQTVFADAKSKEAPKFPLEATHILVPYGVLKRLELLQTVKYPLLSGESYSVERFYGVS